MQYKTIVLQLLEQRPEIYDQLRRHRQVLLTMECSVEILGGAGV